MSLQRGGDIHQGTFLLSLLLSATELACYVRGILPYRIVRALTADEVNMQAFPDELQMVTEGGQSQDKCLQGQRHDFLGMNGLLTTCEVVSLSGLFITMICLGELIMLNHDDNSHLLLKSIA